MEAWSGNVLGGISGTGEGRQTRNSRSISGKRHGDKRTQTEFIGSASLQYFGDGAICRPCAGSSGDGDGKYYKRQR